VIKEAIHSEDKQLLIYVHQMPDTQHHKTKSVGTKSIDRPKYNNCNCFNTPHSPIDMWSRQKVKKRNINIQHYRPNGLNRHLQNILPISQSTHSIQQPMILSPS
jgi:hypothetical protein